jgi:hypothetical protein
MSGEQMVPVVTHLQLRDGRLGGGYNFGPELTEGGTLHDCKLHAINIVACLWRDNYGRGTLLMRFFDKAARFEGEWAPDHDEYDQYPWDGSRTE